MRIKSEKELTDLYGLPGERAKNKELKKLDKHAIHFIETSPFLVLATYNSNGKMDASPRGGSPGFVKVLNEREIIIPDAKGNNRMDSLKNIVDTGRFGALFLIPGIDETLRLNGGAFISTDAELLNLFSSEKQVPKSCIVIEVEEVFLHCAKAFMRSKLWSEEAKLTRSEFPTMGQMLRDQLGTSGEIENQAAMVERYRKDL